MLIVDTRPTQLPSFVDVFIHGGDLLFRPLPWCPESCWRALPVDSLDIHPSTAQMRSQYVLTGRGGCQGSWPV